MTRLGEDFGADEEVEGTPYPSDHWIIGGGARMALEVDTPEARQSFWEPILAFGSAAHYWVKDYLQSWFQIGLAPHRFRRASRLSGGGCSLT